MFPTKNPETFETRDLVSYQDLRRGKTAILIINGATIVEINC